MRRLALAALLLIAVAGVVGLHTSRASAADVPVEFSISPDLPEELLGPENYKVEPSQVFLGAGGGLFMTGIRWTAWGLPITSGIGKAHVRGRCRPNCANARFHKVRAQLILNRIAEAFGHRQYLCWQLAFLQGRRRGRLGAQSCRPGTPATPGQISYVAIGDSYSAGEGVKPFLPGTDTPSDRCHRSAHAYSRQLQFPGVLLLRSFFACSGAVTDNVLSATQYAPEGVPQLAHPEIGPSTNLVTITVGGNDANFTDVLKKCIIPPACNKGRKRAEILAGVRAIPGRLFATYEAIKQRAPNATVVVLGYPALFPPGGTKGLRCNAFQAVARPQQRFINELGIELDGLIAQSTAAAGVWYHSVLNAFRDHAICGSGGEWVRGLTLKRGAAIPRVDEGSFHPNFAGQRAYATGLRSFLLGLIQAGLPLTPAGLPANPPPR